MKSIEELRKEAELAQVAVAEAESKAREKAREARAAVEEAERSKRQAEELKITTAIADAMVAALVAEGFQANHKLPEKSEWRSEPIILVADRDGISVDTPSIEKHYSGRWSRQSAGWKIVLGGYGERKSYFKRADGTYNYAGIAKDVTRRFKEEVEKLKAQAAHKSATQKADDLALRTKAQLGLKPESELIVGTKYRGASYRGGVGYTRVAAKGMVLMQVGTLEVSPERALEVYEALKKAGVLGVTNS